MKTEYQKPYLAVESFQLNAAIAGACRDSGAVPLNHGLNDCSPAEEAPGIQLFGAACEIDIVNDDNPDGTCYQGLTDQGKFFES